MPTPTDSNCIITRNGQYFSLVDQGNEDLKAFFNNIPPCHGDTDTPQTGCLWYHYFTIHASTCGFYLYPYFCFRPSANSLYVFACGYYTPAGPTIATVAVLPAVPAIVDVTGIYAVVTVVNAPAIIAVPATKIAHYDLEECFQLKINNMSFNIYNAISKPKVFLDKPTPAMNC